MEPHQLEQPVLALLCDPQGKIIRILRDELGICSASGAGRLWIGLLEQSSVMKGFDFMREIAEKGACYHCEIDVAAGEANLPLYFTGSIFDEWILLAADSSDTRTPPLFEQEIGSRLNSYADLVRTMLKNQALLSHPQGEEDQKRFDEITGLNNELVNLSRELAKKNAELENRHHLIQRIFDTTPNILYTYDLKEHRVVFANREIVSILGHTPDEITRSGAGFFANLIHPEDEPTLEVHYRDLDRLPDGEILEVEYRIKNERGEWRWIYSRDTVFIREPGGRTQHILCAAQDVTDAKKLAEKLWYMSTHDNLTGLYNRAYFEEEMNRIEKTRSFPISILMADLDGLKEVNDRLGHAAGDELLCRAGTALREAFRQGDVIARVGGDEFSVLFTETGSTTDPGILDRVRHAIQDVNHRMGGVPMNVSLGIATSELPRPLKAVYKQADARMYAEKMARKALRDLSHSRH